MLCDGAQRRAWTKGRQGEKNARHSDGGRGQDGRRVENHLVEAEGRGGGAGGHDAGGVLELCKGSGQGLSRVERVSRHDAGRRRRFGEIDVRQNKGPEAASDKRYMKTRLLIFVALFAMSAACNQPPATPASQDTA